MKKKNSNNLRYIGILGVFIIALALIYVLVYFCFKGNGFVPSGINLEKRDWLSFLGSYLSFAGTIIVSIVAILEGLFYRKRSQEESDKKRKKEIQPIFSIKIMASNTILQGYAEAFSLYDPSKCQRHKNFSIKIENVSHYPIKHLIVFDKYLAQLMKSHESKEIQCAYEDSPDYTHESTKLIRILQSDYERATNGLPKWFNINYEDIDGNDMFQSFELKEFDGVFYYSLVETSDV